MLDQLIDDRRPALVEAHILMGLAAGFVAVNRDSGVARARAPGLKDQSGGKERLRGRPEAGKQGIGENQSLVGDHFEIAAPVRKLLPLRPAHHGVESAAGTKVYFAFGYHPWLRTKPVLDAFRIGPGVPDTLDGDIELAFEDKIEFWIGRNEIGDHCEFSLCMANK